jgi:hypothetical protein
MSRTLAITLVALCASVSMSAQQAATSAPIGRRGSVATAPVAAQRGTVATPVASSQAPTPAPAAAHVDAGLDPSDANITIEVTVVDKAAGTSATTTRQGMITVANQNSGSVRGLGNNYSNSGTKLDPLGLDIDARTYLRKSGMVSVTLTVAYIPTGAEPIMSSSQRQQATLFLKPGQETQLLTTGSMTGPGPAVRITAKAMVAK